MAGQAGGQKPPDPMCPMCGSPLAKSQAGLHVLSKVSEKMAQKNAAPPGGRPSGPGMSAPMSRGPMGPSGPAGPRRF